MNGQAPAGGGAPQFRVLLAGGGTAGHVEPALALAEALLRRSPDTEVVALGTPSGLETRLVPSRGVTLRLIPKVTMPRGSITADRNLRRWLGLPSGLWSALRATSTVLAEVRPDVVVGFGGYVSLPAYLAARKAGVPFVVHEANARPGVANRIGARLTRFVAVSVSSTRGDLPHAELVGIPLRREIAALDRAGLREKARLTFDLDAGRQTLLVFGGSQGARSINEAMQGAAQYLLGRGVQVLHAAGPDNKVTIVRGDTDPPYVVLPYVERMDLAYAAADLVLSRSGAMTCAELAAVGLPAVFVPYPHSNREQAINAQPMIEAGAGLMVRDEELSPRLVEELVGGLLTDPARLEEMSAAALTLGARDADERLADMVLRAAGR